MICDIHWPWVTKRNCTGTWISNYLATKSLCRGVQGFLYLLAVHFEGWGVVLYLWTKTKEWQFKWVSRLVNSLVIFFLDWFVMYVQPNRKPPTSRNAWWDTDFSWNIFQIWFIHLVLLMERGQKRGWRRWTGIGISNVGLEGLLLSFCFGIDPSLTLGTLYPQF